MKRRTAANVAVRLAKPRRPYPHGVNNVRSRRFKWLLAVRRGSRGTVYDGPFDLEDEDGRRLYVRLFRINYPRPKILIPQNDDFFGAVLPLAEELGVIRSVSTRRVT